MVTKTEAAAALTTAQKAYKVAEMGVEMIREACMRATEEKLGPMPPRGNASRPVWRATYMRLRNEAGDHEALARKIEARDALLSAFRVMMETFAPNKEARELLENNAGIWDLAPGSARDRLVELALSA